MPQPNQEICISGSRYIWMTGTPPGVVPTIIMPPETQPPETQPPETGEDMTTQQLSEITDLLTTIAARMPGGAAASTSYRYVEYTIDPRRNDYLVTIGIPARNFNLRFDQPIKLRLGSVSNDQLFMDPTESPFEVLNFSVDIDEIYVTTYANETKVKVLAW